MVRVVVVVEMEGKRWFERYTGGEIGLADRINIVNEKTSHVIGF